MSEAENLLTSLVEGDATLGSAELGTMMLGNNVYTSTEPHVVIGPDRHITVPPQLKRVAVQHDHNIETVIFDCPRYWDGRDLSVMKFYINYIRADLAPGSYPIDSGIVIDENDDTLIHFAWTISREVTEAFGNIVFLVCAKAVDDEGDESKHWNSELCTDMYISEGLEVLETIIQEHPDVITYLLTRMDIVEEKTSLEAMLGYLDTYFTTDADINEVLKNYVTEYLNDSEELTSMVADAVNAYIEEHIDLDTVKSDIETLKEKDTELSTDIETLKWNDVNLGTDVETLKKKDTELSTDIEALKRSNINLGTDIEALKNKDTELTTDIDTLKTNLTASNGAVFRFGIDSEGQYGYIVTDSEGADTVVPFNSGSAKELYMALQYSGLVTEDMSFDEMCSALAAYFPESLDLTKLALEDWVLWEGAKSTTSGTFAVSPFHLTSKSTSEGGVVNVYTAVPYDITNYNTLTLSGSYSVYNTSNAAWVCLYKTIDASNPEGSYDESIDLKHILPKTDATKTLTDETIDVSGLSGEYYLVFRLPAYQGYGSEFMQLDKILFE